MAAIDFLKNKLYKLPKNYFDLDLGIYIGMTGFILFNAIECKKECIEKYISYGFCQILALPKSVIKRKGED